MIPDFDHNNVLPPYIGNATNPNNMSPYPCDIMEFCQHFATSPARIAILKGYVRFRLSCVANGITGHQWIDGSFVENIEVSESRDPHDMDVVTLMMLFGHNRRGVWKGMLEIPLYDNSTFDQMALNFLETL